uniref:C1 domain containing protein n=1 Tax=Pristionchus pacificus TaxID=54126 RepID=A0A2A6B9R2_PRIPA|eukprot:PDM62619.1 C1 domain containing protein [Pristionchus pacificus]
MLEMSDEINNILMDTSKKAKKLPPENNVQFFIRDAANILKVLVQNNGDLQNVGLLETIVEMERKRNIVQNEDNKSEFPMNDLCCKLLAGVTSTVNWISAKEENRISISRENNNDNSSGDSEESTSESEEDEEPEQAVNQSVSDANDEDERKSEKTKIKRAEWKKRKSGDFPCGTCGRLFASKDYLRTHQNTHLPESDPKRRPFVCDQCGKAFTLKFSLQEHKLIHLEDVNMRYPFPCDQCDRRFHADRRLRKHVKAVHSTENDPKKRTFECNQCGNSFASKVSLAVHEQDVNLSHPFPCDQCDKRFRTKAKLKFHVTFHHSSDGGKRFKCSKCGKTYHDGTGLKRHAQHHLDDEEQRRPFKCEQCGKRFPQKSVLKVHTKTHNPIPADEKIMYQCEECGKKYTRLFNLNLHKKTHTGDNLRRVECTICGKLLSSGGIKYHMQTHLAAVNREIHKCETCGKVFISRYGLTSHKAYHCGIRSDQFKCGTCGKILADSKNLKRHERLHLDDEEQRRPFPCDQCGKRLTSNSTLKAHKQNYCRNTMEGQKFSCDLCDKQFSFKYNFEWHKMWHLPDNDPQKKILKCHVCSKTFIRPCSLKRHMKKRHDPSNPKSTQRSCRKNVKMQRNEVDSDEGSVDERSSGASSTDEDEDGDKEEIDPLRICDV